MNKFMQGIIVALVILYVISPVDAYPGLMDDIVVVLVGWIVSKHFITKN